MDRTFGNVTVVLGDKNGKYPHGNSIVVRGSRRTAVIDPSLALMARREEFEGLADLIVLSHVHEDHVAGLSLFPRAEVRAHREDVAGIRSLAGLAQMYGYTMSAEALEQWLVGSFHYAARPDAEAYEDGDVFDLGGSRIRVFHLPGHTRGHSALRIEPEGILFLGDIDLSSFGPYYGDAWSNLEDFERSLDAIAGIEASAWVSFHHVGIIEERALFEEKLGRFAARIAEREEAIREALAGPRRLEDLVARRFVYPPGVDLPFVDAVERRTIGQHLERGVARGIYAVEESGAYRRVSGG